MDLTYKPWHYARVLHFGLSCAALCLGLVLAGMTAWTWLLVTVAVYVFMAVTNSAGYHRLFCHRSYETSKFWEAFLLLTGTLSCYGSSLQYCVVHTLHHRHSDTELDPHHFKTFRDVFSENYSLDRVPYSGRKEMVRLLRRPLHGLVHRFYWAIPAIFSLALLAISWKILLFCYLAPVGMVILSAALFNYIAHDDDGPSNSAYSVLFASGEWRHKLHHDKPHRWDLREKWYHIDCGAYLIMLIKR
jgi:sn-1 stearoyl-lipid 9-desaturase